MLLKNDTFVLAILIILCILLSGLLNFSLKQKNKRLLHKSFIALFTLMLLWLICMILQILFMNKYHIDIKYFFYIYYISLSFLPVAFFYMAVSFTNGIIETKPIHFSLFIVPILSLILLWTNDLHHLFYKEFSIDLSTKYGWYFYVHTVYTYSLFIISLFILIKYSIKNAGFFSKQAGLIIISAFIPLVVNILGSFQIIPISIYVTPICFSFTAIFLSLAIFKFNFLGSTPIALQRIVDRISDGYIVLNTNYEISDFNKTLINVFKLKDVVNLRGINFIELLKHYKVTTEQFLESFPKVETNDSTETFEIEIKDLKKSFNVEISSILNGGQVLGILVLFKDITQHKRDMETIQNNQNMLIERERLSSLGQMIGGIAHNLKTPIMSISGAAEGLNDLADELDNSIGNPIVTNDDYHEIAKDMKNWIAKIKNYSEYMSDIITAVKGQAVNFTNDTEISFTISELVKRVNILMKHELKNAIVYLNVNMKVDENTVIKGDVNSLVQIINNMISNSIQAYNGKLEQNIDLIIDKDAKNNVVISVKDYGPGLPKKVTDKLFKEMITTKGKNGTGLGLYMSYSTIKAHFKGDIVVETAEGQGTTFNIVIPL